MSSGFKFSLQKVLEIREDKEEESKRRFEESQRKKQVTENKLNNLHENYKRYGSIKQGEDIVYQKIKRNYLYALGKNIEETEKELKERDKQLEYSRRDLNERRLEKKTVEILKEKQYTAFIKEQDRIEQINNDEFALYGFMRRLERG